MTAMAGEKNYGFPSWFDPENPPEGLVIERGKSEKARKRNITQHYKDLLKQLRAEQGGTPSATDAGIPDEYEQWLKRNSYGGLTKTQHHAQSLEEQIIGARLGERSILRRNPEPFLMSTGQMLDTDPRVLRAMLDEIARIGEVHDFPVTTAGLSEIEPAQAGYGRAGAHFTPRPGRQWRLGVPFGVDLEGVNRKYGESIGTGRNAAAWGVSPVEAIASHEMGHAVEKGVDRFLEEPAPTRQVRLLGGQWKRSKDQLTADALNNLLSRYSRIGVGKVVNPMLQEAVDLEMRGLKPGPQYDVYRQLRDRALSAIDIIPRDLRGFDEYTRGRMAREAIAESLGPYLGGGVRGPVSAGTAHGIRRGEELMGIIDELRGHGYKGAATPQMMLRGAGAFGAPLLAPIIADRFVPKGRWREAAQGAITGAGIGSMFGAPGAAIGGGLGALASQVF